MRRNAVIPAILLVSGAVSFASAAEKCDRACLVALMGLVFACSIFRRDGTPKMMKIVGVPGVTERKNDYGPFDLTAAHIFKIRNGKIYGIEAIGYVAKHESATAGNDKTLTGSLSHRGTVNQTPVPLDVHMYEGRTRH